MKHGLKYQQSHQINKIRQVLCHRMFLSKANKDQRFNYQYGLLLLELPILALKASHAEHELRQRQIKEMLLGWDWFYAGPGVAGLATYTRLCFAFVLCT